MVSGDSTTAGTSDWVRYWDGGTSSTSTATDWVTEAEYTGTGTTASDWTYYPRQVLKRIIVKPPKHWSKKINDFFVNLVNDKTNTGWKVTALLREIEIVDPMIDVREMRDFIGLLKARASTHDRGVIDAFFKKHGLDGKPKRTRAKK